MKFVFISTPTFEPWDWTNPDTKGIGGSETSHIEMAQRLRRLGHKVISFAPTGTNNPQVDPAGVTWFNFESTIPYLNEYPSAIPEADVIVLYRCPEMLDKLPKDAIVWLICQDVDYEMSGNVLTPERAERLTRLVGLCQTHGQYFRAKYSGARVSVSSNGIKRALIDEIAADPPERNPHRLMYASSPDRGMEYLLEIFPRLREMIPDAELHIYYGFDNIEKVISWFGENHQVAYNTAKLRKLLAQPGVTFHGRLGQPELLREWFKAGLWVHPSHFTETSCITCMDAQACGAIPVTTPIWAVAENVQHGVFIEGDVRQGLVKARYVQQAFSLMAQPELQEEIRGDMMAWARETFDWDIFARQWEGWARNDQWGRGPKTLEQERAAVDEMEVALL
jgi:glycosyltransferase involved in cell wall biosynthesis